MIRKKGRNTVPIAKNAVSRPSTGLDRAAEAICEPFPNMNGRFSPHKSFSQVKTKITLFFKISYFRPYVYSFCHHFLTKKVNSAPFFIILPVQKRFSRGIIPKKNTNGRTPIFGHHYPIMARFRHFTHPTTAGNLHFETLPGGMIPTGRATRQEPETGNGDGERTG